MSRKRVSRSVTQPAPIGGLNARDPLAVMSPQDAIVLDNWFPANSSVRVRKGFTPHCTISGASSADVETLATHKNANGTETLIAVSNNKFWNCTTESETDITGSLTVTSDRWQHEAFRNSGNSYLVFCNGVNTPKLYSSSLADVTFTGSGLTTSNLIQAKAYKRRLYFLEKDSTKFWYLAVDAIAGTASSFDVGSLLSRGGKLLSIQTWSGNFGGGLENTIVLISDQGEILVYSGDDFSTNVSLIGQYYIPRPIGIRAFLNYDSDLLIMTQEGIVPLSKVINNESNQVVYKITDKIQNAFTDVASSYFDLFGWEIFHYPKKNHLIVNCPISPSKSVQYVMNTLTGAWCRFTGINANTWTIFNNKPIFASKTSGVLFEYDKGTHDNEANIETRLKTAFSFYGDDESVKHFTLARPNLLADRGLSFTLDIDTDFSNKIITSRVEVQGGSGAEWDSTAWDSAPWADTANQQILNWYGIRGVGRCGALRIEADLKNVSCELTAFNILYQSGGIL